MDAHTARGDDVIDTDEEHRLAVAIGDELRGLRNKRKMSQDQLAETSGVGKRTIIRIEAGEKAPDMGQLYRLCKALRVRPSVVLDAAEEEAVADIG
jgi:transcriptional regulator with XRE-family HTH domain